MYNYFMLIGTVCKEVEVKEVADGKRVVSLVLACLRPFPNVDGTRTTDFFNISLWEFLADLANDSITVGSKIAVKGRLLPKLVTLESGAKIHINELVGEYIYNITPKNENLEPQIDKKADSKEEE